MMHAMIRTPVFLAILALAAPAGAAPGDARGWKLDAGGALSVASFAFRAIDRGDIAAVADDTRGPRVPAVSDPTRIGLRSMGRDDTRTDEPVARISARFSF